MQNYVTSPEQTSQQHGSNASLNNILQHPPRSNTTRSMPNEFTIEQSGQPATKRRKSGTIFVNPPHQPDQAYIQQGQYQYQSPVQPFYFIPQQSQIQIPNLPQTIAPRNNNTSTRHGLGFAEAYNQRSKSNAISNNNIFNNSEKNQQAVLPTSQVISNQNNPHVSIPSQIVAPQIGFQNQVQMNNSQQQILQHGNNQGQVQQFPLDVLRPTSGQILYQVSQVPQVQQVQQVQQIQQSIHTSPIMDNQMYVNDTSSISTQETIQPLYQRLEILKSEIENKDFYQSRCEELNTYLNNENVYPHSQYNLYLCLKSVRNKAVYGLEIATKVFRNAMANINRFDLTYQGHIKKWFSELNKPSSSSSINGRSVSQRSSSLHGNPQLRQLHLLQQQQQQLQQQQQHQQHQQHQQQQINVSVNPPRIEQRPATDIEKANANWISRIIDRAWGHVMLPYESPIINHQAQQEFVNSFYVPHEKFERIWKPDTPFPPVHVHPNKLPITYRLISRKPSNLDDDNKCDWPPEEATFKIHINDSEIKLHRKQRIPIKQNQYSFVGVDKPVDIVQYLVAGVNRIKIIQCMCDPCRQQLNDHILSIEILVKETEDIVLRNARSQTLTKDHGTGIVKRLISGPSSSKQSTSPASSIGILGQNNGNTMIIDDDCDITVNKMKVSLRCPISLLRISEPAKGQNCRHIGCFDLQTYVNVNKKNCKWRCPECNDRVTSETLRTDEYFRELLEEIPKNVNIVELDSSGNWTIVGQDDGDGGETTDDEEVMQMDAGSKRSSLPSTSSKSDKVPAAIIILDDDDDEPAPNTSDSQQQAQSTQSTQSNNIPTTTTTTTTYSQSLWPTAVRQSSTPGVPYMVPVRTSNQTNQTNDQFIQSPPPSANISTTTIVQSPPDTTMYDPVRNNNSVIKNNNNKSKRNNNRRERKSRRGRVASQEKGNSSTKDNNNNDENNIDNDNSSGRLNNSNWSYVMGISSSQQDYNNILSSPQDIVSQTATQVASPISPVSVTNPNLHPMQDEIEEGEWLTEDEQEEVVLDSSKTILR